MPTTPSVYEQIDQPVRLRSRMPTNLRVARFILTGLRDPTGDGADRCYTGANLMVIVDDDIDNLDLSVGDVFQVRDQKWRLGSVYPVDEVDSAAFIHQLRDDQNGRGR